MNKNEFEAYTKSLGLNREAPLKAAKPYLKFYTPPTLDEVIVQGNTLIPPTKSTKERLEQQRRENIKVNDEAFEKAHLSTKERPFAVIDIPDVMQYKLGWPKSAEVMRKWFALPGRAMTKDEKEGRDRYVDTHTDIAMFKWKWLESFERVKKAKEVLLSDKVLWSDVAKKAMLRRIKASGHDLTEEAIDNDALGISELHARWQFQYSKVGYELGAVDDLYGSLGNFALYASIQKAHLYEEDGQSYLRVTEVAIYMRDTFDFLGGQYLGHWSFDGMGINAAGGLFNLKDWEWKLAAWNPKHGVQNAFGNKDFREYRERCNMGGDLLLFSDIITVDVDETIQITS